ncbi:tape measure protein [Stenotrophomonas sp. PUT21]|uniref:tape measure protein n=1 Tax=Stenotrophomonas TaxID=40323 RepID=UPI003B7B75B8
MSTSLRELIVSVTADTTKYQREMDRAGRMGAQYFRSVRQEGAQASQSWNAQTTAARTHANAVEASSQAIGRYAAVAAAAFSVGNLISMADDWGQISARIRLATQTQDEFALAQTRLLEIANRTYRDFNEAADQFAGTAQSMREMGFAASDTLDSAEALGLALVAGGSNAQRGAAANDAWAKSMVQGRIATDQFQTLLLQTPRVVQALGEGLGKTTQQLQQMAKDGQLTAQVVVPAITSQMGKLRAEVEAMPTTVQDAGIRFRNELRAWVGSQNDAYGATQVLVGGLELVTENLETLITVGGAAALGGLAGRMVQIGAATAQAAVGFVQNRVAIVAEAVAIRDATAVGLAKAQSDLRRAQASVTAARGTAESARQSRNLAAALLAERQASIAAAEAQVAYGRATSLAGNLGRGLLGVLGGPAGLAITLGTVAAGWLLFRDSSSEATAALREMTGPLDEVLGKFQALGAAQQMQAIREAEKQVAEATGEMRRSMEQLRTGMDNWNLRPMLDAIKRDMDAGTLTVEDGSRRIAAVLERYSKTGYYSDSARDHLIATGAAWEENARKAQEATQRLDGFRAAQEATKSPTDAAADSARKQAEALRQVGGAAADANQQLQGLQGGLNSQIVNLVRVRDGAIAAMKVEIGQQINAAGGVGALTAEQRAEFNRQIEMRSRLIQQTEAAQEASKRSAASSRSGAKSGEQWAEYSAQLQRSIAQQDELSAAYGRGESAVAAANRQHEIEVQVLRLGEAHRAEITRLIDAENEARSRAYGAEQIANLERQIATYGLVGNAAKMAYETAAGSLSMLSQEQKSALEDGARWLDWLDEMADIEKVWDQQAAGAAKFASEAESKFGGLSAQADQAARNMQSSFADFLFDPFEDGVGGMVEGFGKAIQRMMAEAAASQIFQMVGSWASGYSGAGSGWVNAVGGAISQGAGKAAGGPVSARSMQPVAEYGPELLQVGGQTMLMMGAQPGLVSPLMNGRAGGGASSSAAPIQVITNVSVTDGGTQTTSSGTNDQLGQKLGTLVSNLVKSELIQQKRPGGILA